MEEILDKIERAKRVSFLVDQCDGIDPPLVVFYVHSILFSARAADRAFLQYRLSNAAQDSEGTVQAVQEGMIHAAGLSRFFWPSPPRKKPSHSEARGCYLRKMFDMKGSVLEDRAVRNALEHFDERLDEWALLGPHGYLFPGPLVESSDLADDPSGHIFRLVDPENSVFVILGEKFPFGEVRRECSRVLSMAESLVQ